ncbi:hypothetical protein JCM10003_2443 [Bacteroides pyogenes JCM 10003]|nr:hypothetical protein JCM10003_2443 [Bacteroides pyogenes JCM 10003]
MTGSLPTREASLRGGAIRWPRHLWGCRPGSASGAFSFSLHKGVFSPCAPAFYPPPMEAVQNK